MKTNTMNKHPRHEVRYWPMFRSPEANERAFPKGFLFACFLALGLWILIAYLLS